MNTIEEQMRVSESKDSAKEENQQPLTDDQLLQWIQNQKFANDNLERKVYWGEPTDCMTKTQITKDFHELRKHKDTLVKNGEVA